MPRLPLSTARIRCSERRVGCNLSVYRATRTSVYRTTEAHDFFPRKVSIGPPLRASIGAPPLFATPWKRLRHKVSRRINAGSQGA